MIRWRRHPRYERLVFLADGDLDPEEAARVREHLVGCPRCRREVAFIRRLAELARELPHPEPPPDLWERILARRAAGERAILPNAPPQWEEPPRRWRYVLAVALVAGAAALALLVGGREASAGASELRVAPEGPRPGERVRLEFRTASPLAQEERLRVRGWYRVAQEPPPRDAPGAYVEAALAGRGGGRFTGDLLLPPSAVYAAFVVEDLGGGRVETNRDRLWELLAHDGDARPLFEALRQQFRVAEFRESTDALVTARRMTELYPERAEGWFYRLVLERGLFPGRRDSLEGFYRRELVRLERVQATAGEPGAEEVAALARLAHRLGEAETAARWKARLVESHPYHVAAIQERVLEAIRDHRGDPAGLLARLEAEWKRTGPASELLAEQGFHAALETGLAEPLRTWSRRYLQVRPDLGWLVAEELAELPALRGDAAALLRSELGRRATPEEATRAPERTAEEERANRRARARRALATLGSLLLAEGQVAAALDTLALAAAEGWNPDLFQRLAPLHLAAGDTAGALRLWAFVEADPLAAPAEERVRGRLGPRFDGRRWTEARREAEREMRRRILSTSEDRSLDLGAKVRSPDGRDLPLGELVAGEPAILAYCSPLFRFCREAVEALADRTRWPRSARVKLAVIWTDAPQAETAGEAAGDGLKGFIDVEGEVARSLGSHRIPQFTVIDAEGRIRFRHGALEHAVRQALLLAEDRPPPR